MCHVSDKIKFCTCTVSLGRLKNYWMLHRFVKGKHEIVVGEPLMPYDVDEKIDANNKAVLLKRLNEPDAFDVPLHPREKDRLEIAFRSVGSGESSLVYGFMFKDGRWVEEPYDAFEWMMQHEEAAYGKLKNIFK